ncbi:hypothetical protein Tco_0808240 [Tanacetum coccineum]
MPNSNLDDLDPNSSTSLSHLLRRRINSNFFAMRSHDISKVSMNLLQAWSRFNDLLRHVPHHGFSELHQLDTFYNAMNIYGSRSLNSSSGWKLLDKMPRECLKIIEASPKVPSKHELTFCKDRKNQASAQRPAPATCQGNEQCVTCGGAHSHKTVQPLMQRLISDNFSE